ncbi:MAG: hypothetical protein RSF82_09145 [Angelakisella sp.]
MKRILKIILCLILATGLCVGATAITPPQTAIYPTQATEANTTTQPLTQLSPEEKSEMVYVNLNADGTPREKIVTNRLHSGSAGVVLTDSSDLSDIRPIKGGKLISSEGEKLLWQLEDSDLYYRGSTQRTLPLDVTIRYSMDGVEAAPEQLAGQSGHLAIDIDLRNNCPQSVVLNGKNKTLYSPVSATIGMLLPDDTFRNVTVSDGTVVGDGNRYIVGIVAMPGLRDSLELTGTSIPELDKLDFPEHFTVTADVTDFEMGPIAIAATTQFPDKNISSEFADEIHQNLTDLKDMQNKLERMDGDRSIRTLFSDSKNREAAKLLTDDIFDFYELDTDIVEVLNRIATPRNMDTLDDLFGKLESMERNGLLTSSTITGLQKLAQGDHVDNLYAMLGHLDAAAQQLEPVLPLATDESIDLMSSISAGTEQLPQLMAAYKAAFGSMTDAQLVQFVQAGMAAVSGNGTSAPSGSLPIGVSDALNKSSDGEVSGSLPIGISGDVLGETESDPDSVGRAPHGSYAVGSPDPHAVQAAVGFLKGVRSIDGMMTAVNNSSPATKQALAAGKQLLANPAQLKGMRNMLVNDYKANAATLEILRTEIDATQLKQLGTIPALFASNFKELSALSKKVKPMLEDYDLPKLKRDLPHTLGTLTRIKHDLENNRNISEILKKVTAPDNSSTFAEIISTLDRLEKEGVTDKYLEQTADLCKLIENANTVSTLAEPDVKYIMKTDSVKLPESASPVQPAPAQPTGLMDKLKSKLRK